MSNGNTNEISFLSGAQKKEVREGLLEFGLSENEVTVYLSVLQGSDSSVPSLAAENGLSRGTVYDVVEKLKDKGYVSEMRKGKKRRLAAANPTGRLYSWLDGKHDALERTKRIANRILPTLKALESGDDARPQIRVYEGERGFRLVWDEIFADESRNFLSISRVETFLSFAGAEFLEEIMARKRRLGFSSRAINEDSPAARMMRGRDEKEHRETRLAPAEYGFSSTEIIYGDRIAMFSTRKENTIVVIESRDFAETHRAYFEMLWNNLENK